LFQRSHQKNNNRYRMPRMMIGAMTTAGNCGWGDAEYVHVLWCASVAVRRRSKKNQGILVIENDHD